MSTTGALPLNGPATTAGTAGQATPGKAVAAPIPGKLGLGLLVALVIAAGGGGIPVARDGAGSDLQGLHGVAAVIDKDLWSSLLTRELQADVLVIATDVAAVFLDRGRPTQRAIGKLTPQALAGHDCAAGSMGPKVEAARAFVLATGHRAVIGSLERIEALIAGTAGTQACTETAGGADTL